MKHLLFALILIPLVMSLSDCSKEKHTSWEFSTLPASVKSKFFERKPAKHVLVDPDHKIWGLSVIKWKDGKYHAYYSRWPDSLGFKAWLSHSEIAHAVADNPEGPFRFVNVVVESRHEKGWDVINAHNPYVCKAEDKICLYYISNELRGKYEHEVDSEYPEFSWFIDNWDKVRNTQRIGVAVASDPAGPFERAEEPVVEPHGNFKNIAVNPAVTYVDGKYVMIMKGDDTEHDAWHRIQLVGHASNPEGPFTFSQKPVYAATQTEDACIWYDKQFERYYMTCHVMGKRDFALFSSEDSYNWTFAGDSIFMKKQIVLDDGTIWKPRRVERPYVLTNEKGKPVMFYVAAVQDEVSGNIAIPVK